MTIAEKFIGLRRDGEEKRLLAISKLPETVMKKGPVITDGSRSQGQLFREFCAKSETVMVTNPGGERFIGMVVPEVRSRKGSTARNANGPYEELRGKFSLTASLYQHLQALDAEKLKPEDVLKRFDGVSSIGELRRYAGELLRDVYYRSVGRKLTEGKAQTRMGTGNVTVRGVDERDHVIFMTPAQYQVETDRLEAREKRGKTVKLIVAAAVEIASVAACAGIPTLIPKQSEATPLPTGAPVKSPAATKEVQKPTTVPTRTEAPKVEPTVYHVEGASGGIFTEAQDKINNSQSALDQEVRIQRWLDYWINFDNRPFAPDTREIHWKYIYNDLTNPTEVMVLIEAGGEYGGKLFTVPLGNNGLADFPPPVSGKDIAVGFGLLELSSGTGGGWLSVENGIPVRRNNYFGNVIERLNMKTGQWEATEPTKKAPTATPEGVDYSQAFGKDPQSIEEIKNVPEAPSPIDKTVEFKVWQEGYLAAVNEKLKTYDGPTINIVTGGDATIGYETSMLNLIVNGLEAIGSYKFPYRGEEILVKSFVVKVKAGTLAPLQVAYPGSCSPFKTEELLLKNPSEKSIMRMLYDRNSIDKFFSVPFIDDYFAALVDLGNGKMDSWLSFLANQGTDEGRYNFSRAPFVVTTFVKY